MVAERKDDVAPELEEFAQKSEVHSIIMQADQEARRRKIAKERAERPAGGGGGDDEEDEEDDPEDVEELRAVKGEEGAGGAASLAVSVHQMGAGADLATLPHCALILVAFCVHISLRKKQQLLRSRPSTCQRSARMDTLKSVATLCGVESVRQTSG